MVQLHPKYPQIMLLRGKVTAAEASRRLGIKQDTVARYWHYTLRHERGQRISPGVKARIAALRGHCSSRVAAELVGDGVNKQLVLYWWARFEEEERAMAESKDDINLSHLWYPAVPVLEAMDRFCSSEELNSTFRSVGMYWDMRMGRLSHIRLDSADKMLCRLGLTLHDIDCEHIYSRLRPGGTMKEQRERVAA